MITKQDIDNMTPEELEEFKHEASMAIAKKFAAIFIFKVGMGIALRRLAKKLGES